MFTREREKPSGVSLKLVVDKISKRVLYGVGDQKFVDFLLTMLSLPLGAVVDLLSHHLFGVAPTMSSLQNLHRSVEALGLDDNYFQSRTAPPAAYFSATGATLRYMVMDDLTLKPFPSSASTISLLNQFRVYNVADVQERLVHFTKDLGVRLLRASLMAENVLTSLFFRYTWITDYPIIPPGSETTTTTKIKDEELGISAGRDKKKALAKTEDDEVGISSRRKKKKVLAKIKDEQVEVID